MARDQTSHGSSGKTLAANTEKKKNVNMFTLYKCFLYICTFVHMCIRTYTFICIYV